MNRALLEAIGVNPAAYWPEVETLPLAYRLLAQIEAPVVARLDIGEFFGFDVAHPLPELSIEEVARSFGPLEEYSAPDQHSERVQFYDVAGRRETSNFDTDVTLELVRQAVPVESVAIVQRIGTWARLTAFVAGGADLVYELYDGTVGPFATAVGTPFPFPLDHPDGGTLTIEYTLIRERVPDAGKSRQPAFLQPTNQFGVIPCDTPLLAPWRDQRYGWNAGFAESLYFVTGDRSLLRLFATIITRGPGRWSVSIAGRLGGDIHVTGYRKAALDHAIYRH